MTTLCTARKARGLSQLKLAMLTGVHPQVISGAERGVLIPSKPAQEAIAKVLGVSAQELFPEAIPGYGLKKD